MSLNKKKTVFSLRILQNISIYKKSIIREVFLEFAVKPALVYLYGFKKAN